MSQLALIKQEMARRAIVVILDERDMAQLDDALEPVDYTPSTATNEVASAQV